MPQTTSSPVWNYVVMVLFFGAIAVYVFRSYRKMGSRGMAQHYGFGPDEKVTQLWQGESTDEELIRAVSAERRGNKLTFLLGSLVSGGNYSPTWHNAMNPAKLSTTINLAFSDRGRVAIATVFDTSGVKKGVFLAEDVEITVGGESEQVVHGLTTQLVQLKLSDGRDFEMALPKAGTKMLQSLKRSTSSPS